MISKKSRKVIAAVLIGATVCASGTFAYFNSKTNLNNIMDKNADAKNTLNITNGHVEIDGQIKTSTIGNLKSNWTYDVARIAGYGSGINADTFEKQHRSPDITGVGEDESGNKVDAAWTNVTTNYPDGTNKTMKRVEIGAPVTGVITNARPGDAIVLGVAKAGVAADAADVDGSGLTFLNKSNITTNIRIDVQRDENGKILPKVIDEFAKLSKAGWIMRINGTEYNLSNLNYANLNEPTKPRSYDVTLVDTPEGDASHFKNYYPDATTLEEATNKQNEEKTAYNTAKAAYDSARTNFATQIEKIVKTVYAVEPATAEEIEAGGKTLEQASFGLTIRFELPLLTENKFQGKDTVGSVAGDDGVDIRNIFTIVATQENNPGWNQDGSGKQPWN